MRRGHHADVDANRIRAADALDKAVLQHAQESHLGIERQLADFVEEQRAHVGPLEPALPRVGRAGEAAFLVAEELRVDQLARNRTAIHADERARVAIAAIVNRAGDQFLARAGLAEDQHRHVRAADHVDPLHHLPQAGVFADDRLACVFAAEAD